MIQKTILILLSLFGVYASNCVGACYQFDVPLGYKEIVIHEDTTGCCNAEKIFIIAQELEDSTIIYDGSYQRIPYPNGDIDPEKGVCTDLIIRTLRIALQFDLQKEVYLFRKSLNQQTDTNIDPKIRNYHPIDD